MFANTRLVAVNSNCCHAYARLVHTIEALMLIEPQNICVKACLTFAIVLTRIVLQLGTTVEADFTLIDVPCDMSHTPRVEHRFFISYAMHGRAWHNRLLFIHFVAKTANVSVT